MPQTTLQLKERKPETASPLKEFEKSHSQSFLYFLQEYEKWQELKKKSAIQ
ncbi:MAG TPA: hypothetical protein VJH23_02070 [archaeon]|nr:hypothetical protein [archaeon]